MKQNDNLVLKSLSNIGKDSLAYLPGQLIPSIVGFIALSIYTRIFSAEDFGDYSIIMATVSLLGVFTYAWLNNSNIRFFSSYKSNDMLASFFTNLLFILAICFFCIICILLILFKLSFIPFNISNYLIYLVGVLVANSIFEISITFLRADRKPKTVSLINLLATLFSFSTSLFFIYFLNYGIAGIFIGYISTYLIISIYSFGKSKLYSNLKLSTISKSILREFTCYGFPLTFTLLFSWILIISDRYMIAYLRDSSEVGIYSAAYQLASYPMTLISSIIMMSAFPIIINSWEKNESTITIDLISNASKYYLLIAIPSFVGITVLSKEIMLLLGDSYSIGANVLPWVCFGTLFSGLCMYTNKGFELRKKTKELSFLVGLIAISNVLMNYLLIPKFGYYGAGVSTGLSYLFYFLLSSSLSKYYLKWVAPVKSIYRIIFSSFIMSSILIIMKGLFNNSLLNLLLLILIGGLTYITILYLVNEIKEEVRFIFRQANKLIYQ